MLLIEHPPTHDTERDYVFRVLLGDFLGLDYQTVVSDRTDIRITDGTARSAELRIADTLFQTQVSDWLTRVSLPSEPLQHLKGPITGIDTRRIPDAIPVIYGTPLPDGEWICITRDRIELGLDVFGSAFFMLTRYEELVVSVRDRHNRFPAVASLAYRAGFLNRPVVNEFTELLWSCLARLFPGLRRRPRQPHISLTFDVDWPAITLGVSPVRIVRAAVADVVRRREPMLATRRLSSWRHVRRGDIGRDAGNIFAAIMDTAEEHNLQATFYMIAGEGLGDIDGAYTVEHPWIRRLLRDVHTRGHLIGLHPTYRSYQSPERISREFSRLRAVCEEEGVSQSAWGGRQHYLRWEAPSTWQYYADAGLDYDSTLAFADHVGFRCGTCHAYPVFNLKTRQILPLRERPLLAMDATMFGEQAKDGMNLKPAAAIEELRQLNAACARYDGDFTTLWHNNWLLQSRVDTAFRGALQFIGS